jgi:hypothetical protein
MTRKTIAMALGLALAVMLMAVPANAQSIRTFVSTTGLDSNPCSITQPCRHFSAAVAATAVGGEVDALEAGAYGSFTITQAITIEGQGWSYVAPGANGNAITIAAVSGNVKIHGVLLNGVGTTGSNGIVFNSGTNLTVTDCVAQNFTLGVDGSTGHGILIQPTSGAMTFDIENTTVSNNNQVGIYYSPRGSAKAIGVVDHVVATNNFIGMAFDTVLGGGSAAVAISNSIASNNSSTGIEFANESSALQGSIDNSTISGNSFFGIDAENASDLEIGRSVITYNSQGGVNNNTTPDKVYSYGDNRINSNTPNIGGSHGSTLAQSHALQ